MIKVFCDRCGNEITASDRVGYLAWNFKETPDSSLVSDNPYEDSHFCLHCMDEIRTFISGTEVRVRIENRIENRPKKNKRRRIDADKMWALKEAGLTAAQIAGEMQMTVPSVYTWFSSHKGDKR